MSNDVKALVEQVLNSEDAYSALGLDATVDDDAAIRKAYLKRSLKLHPDKCKEDKATLAFQRIAQSYEYLKDASARSNYARQRMFGGGSSGSGFEGQFGQEPIVINVSLDEALNMFQSYVSQFNDTDRELNLFDHASSALLWLDSFVSTPREERSADQSSGPEEHQQVSTLRKTAGNLKFLASAVYVGVQLSKTLKNAADQDAEDQKKRASS